MGDLVYLKTRSPTPEIGLLPGENDQSVTVGQGFPSNTPDQDDGVNLLSNTNASKEHPIHPKNIDFHSNTSNTQNHEKLGESGSNDSNHEKLGESGATTIKDSPPLRKGSGYASSGKEGTS